MNATRGVRRYRVRGKVQGVAFRANARRAALSLAISLPLRGAAGRFGVAWRLAEAALGVITIALGCRLAALLLPA